MSSNNIEKNNESEITIKETSLKLDLSESTVKKYLKDFDLKVEKGQGSKAVISKETFQALSEIAKLRANNLSIQEIKELKGQEPSKHILERIEETQESQNEKIIQPEKEGLSETNVSSANEINTVVDIVQEIQEEKDLQEVPLEEGLEDEKPRRRRGFNYRYVERQIANDSKRVSILKRRLQNPNLSIQEKLFFEEALERRILFLNGWRHILRWVSKQ